MLVELGRCPVCSFHPPTQGHRLGCDESNVDHSAVAGGDAYRQGLCAKCGLRRYRAASPVCEPCFSNVSKSSTPERNPQ